MSIILLLDFSHFGVGATSRAINTLFNSSTLSNVSLNRAALDNMSIGQLISTWFISLIVYLGVMIMIVAIIIVLASRIIEVFMYLGISPIPVATLVEGGEFGSIGKNWIKQFDALSFHGIFYCLAIAIFKTLFNNTISTINSADPNSNVILQNGNFAWLCLCINIHRFAYRYNLKICV